MKKVNKGKEPVLIRRGHGGVLMLSREWVGWAFMGGIEKRTIDDVLNVAAIKARSFLNLPDDKEVMISREGNGIVTVVNKEEEITHFSL